MNASDTCTAARPVTGDMTIEVLLVEDDVGIAEPLIDTLLLNGYTVQHVTTAGDALEAPEPMVVLLDLGLPDLDGLEVCRRLRSRSNVAIIVVTARDDEVDRVMSLEIGADDYVVKPFSTRELLARIRAVVRRMTASTVIDEQADVPQQIGTLTIDRKRHRVHLEGLELEFTAKEFEVLAYLAESPGTVRSRSEIMSDVWDANWYGPTKTVDVHIASIRRKLGDARWIESVRGIGFRLESPAQ
ncbi:MAG: response regulator [Acidimicrobiia bacterium]